MAWFSYKRVLKSDQRQLNVETSIRIDQIQAIDKYEQDGSIDVYLVGGTLLKMSKDDAERLAAKLGGCWGED
jgi:hypothetical protein